MTATPDELRRENLELRKALGAVKILALQRDLYAIDGELAGYPLDFEDGEPIVPSRYQNGGGA